MMAEGYWYSGVCAVGLDVWVGLQLFQKKVSSLFALSDTSHFRSLTILNTSSHPQCPCGRREETWMKF